MATIFTKIAKGEIPSYKCAESDDFYAFLDISPLAAGHTLVIPKNVEDDYIFHLDEATYAGLWAFARKVAYRYHCLSVDKKFMDSTDQIVDRLRSALEEFILSIVSKYNLSLNNLLFLSSIDYKLLN